MSQYTSSVVAPVGRVAEVSTGLEHLLVGTRLVVSANADPAIIITSSIVISPRMFILLYSITVLASPVLSEAEVVSTDAPYSARFAEATTLLPDA